MVVSSWLRRLRRWCARTPGTPLTGIAYWRARARAFGPRAVLNLDHAATDYAAVTERQRQLLLPLLRAACRGDERIVLDLGCGPGRFTADLAGLVRGRAIGIDVVPDFLLAAPRSVAVDYLLFDGRVIPLADGSVDVAWIALVLGGITDAADLAAMAAEIARVLRPDGLLFLAENAHHGEDAPHWRFRRPDDYRALFPGIALTRVGGYDDRGEPIEVLAGRRRA